MASTKDIELSLWTDSPLVEGKSATLKFGTYNGKLSIVVFTGSPEKGKSMISVNLDGMAAGKFFTTIEEFFAQTGDCSFGLVETPAKRDDFPLAPKKELLFVKKTVKGVLKLAIIVKSISQTDDSTTSIVFTPGFVEWQEWKQSWDTTTGKTQEELALVGFMKTVHMAYACATVATREFVPAGERKEPYRASGASDFSDMAF